MGSTDYVILGGIGVFASLSFFFSLAESSLFALGKWRARQLAERLPARGGVVLRLLERPNELLATITLGNTLANGSMVVMMLLPALEGRLPRLWTLAAALLLVLVGCEVVPKTLAVRAPESWAQRVALPLAWIQRSTGWFQRAVQQFSDWLLRTVVVRSSRSMASSADAEYQELVELAFQQGTLGQSEKEIIVQIISLDRRTAREVMRPRAQMDAIPDTLSVEEMLAAARKFKHRRLPMFDENLDTIVGILNTQALLLDPQIDLADAIEFPSFVPGSMNLLQLLKSLQKQQRGLAIVLDEFGGTAGLVTIADILETVVGEIRDEGEVSGFVMEKLGADRWRVNGTMSLDDFRREYPQLGETPDVATMGGLLVALKETVPTVNEYALFHGLKLTAAIVDERRVRELLVEVVKRRPAA